MSVVRLAHGIREYKAKSHMAPLAAYLKDVGVPCEHVTYGPILIPVTNQKAVNAIMEQATDGDDLVGFSNGCWGVHQALELGLKARHVYIISGALNVNAEFPNCESVTVFHSSSDWQTRLAKSWRRATRFLPWRWRNPHGWGEMGRVGYQGEDPKVINVDMGSTIGHSWYDYPETVRIIGNHVHMGAT